MSAQLAGDDPVDARVVKALGHPTRVRILAILRDRELASPVELSAELGVPLGTIGYHVRRLETLGFIELAKRTQRRGAVEHHYRARRLLDEPAASPPPPARLPRTGRGADAVAAVREAYEALGRGGFDAAATRAQRPVLRLDERGSVELQRALMRWQAAVDRIARASAERLVRAQRPVGRRGVLVLLRFELPDEPAG